MSHPRAKLTVQGRQLLVQRVLQDGWSVPMAAEAQGCSSATGYKWIRRFLAEGLSGLADRSSRPHRSPGRLSPRREAAILSRREETLEGPHRIGWALGKRPPRCIGSFGAWEHHGCVIWIDPAAPSCAMSESVPVSSSTSTSKSRARSPPVAVGGSMDVRPCQAVTGAQAMTSSMPRSMTVPAWRMRRSCR